LELELELELELCFIVIFNIIVNVKNKIANPEVLGMIDGRTNAPILMQYRKTIELKIDNIINKYDK